MKQKQGWVFQDHIICEFLDDPPNRFLVLSKSGTGPEDVEQCPLPLLASPAMIGSVLKEFI